MALPNRALRLTLLAALACGGSQAQKITRADSVLLFRTAARVTASNGDLVMTKGKVTHTRLRPDGSADVYVFKQHTGFLKTNGKIKDLPAGPAVLPGLTHLRVEPGRGITTVSDEIFNLNSGLRQPIGYELLDINAARPRSEAPVVLTDDKRGADYNQVLKENPAALGYPGDSWTAYVYDSPDRSTLQLISQQAHYNPFSASQLFPAPQSRKVMALSTRALPLVAAPLVYDNEEKGTARAVIAFRPDDGAFVALDSLGNLTRTETLPELKGLRPLVVNTVYVAGMDGMQAIAEALRPVGVDYVLGLTISDKGYKDGNYRVVRLANDGKVLFQHAFRVVSEDYTPSGLVNVASNANECIVRVELRKGVLKYLTASVKINQGGVVYNRTMSAEELKALPVTRGQGEGTLPGNMPTKDWYLFSLPAGENLTVAQEASNTQWYSYSILHLNADGSVKRLYLTGTRDKNLDVSLDRQPGAVMLADGRLLLVAAESTGLAKTSLAPYSTLEANLADGYPAQTQGVWNAGEKNLLFNATVMGDKVERKGAGGFLEKMARTTEVGSLAARPTKLQYTAEALGAPVTAPSVMLVDPKAGTVSRYNLQKTGGYSLPDQPLLYVDAATGRFTYFSRTLPERKARALTDGKGAESFGSGIYLIVTQGEL